MKRLLLLLTLLSLPASAGPTIVEAGGFLLLPKLKLTSTAAGTLTMGTPAAVLAAQLKLGYTQPVIYLESSALTSGQSNGLIFWGNPSNAFSWVLGGHVATGLDGKSFELTDGNTNHLQIRVPTGGNNQARMYFSASGATLSSDAQFVFKHGLAALAPGVDNNIPTLMIKGDTGGANETGDILQAATNAGTVVAGITLSGSVYSSIASGSNAFTQLQGARHTFDGSTGAKYLSSDGTTLTLTGLTLNATQFLGPAATTAQIYGQMADGASAIGTKIGSNVTLANAAAKLVSVQNNGSEKDYFDLNGGLAIPGSGGVFSGTPPLISGGVALGAVSSFAAICNGSAVSYSLNNCMMYSQALDTYVNAPTGSLIGFRINNAVIGTWGTAGLVIGNGGTAITKSVAGSGTLDFASAAISTCSADLTITVTGAVAAAPVELGVPNGSVAAGSQFFAWASATNTVSVRHCCIGAATCDPASGTFSARVNNP